MRSKLPNDEFEQIESFEVDFRIFLLEQLSEQDLQGLNHLFGLGRRYLGHLTLDDLLERHDDFQSLLGIRSPQLCE